MQLKHGFIDVALLFLHVIGSYASIDYLELVMPRYAIRGGDVILKCNHSVPPEQLYKVEWQKAGTKIFQYIKGRSPPFRFFTTSGAELNKNYSNEKQLQLSKLDFSASGLYSCVVSMETPIFSKDSESHMLTVIEPQNRDPIVTFNKGTYEIGEILLANCTTAPARPPPHITWLINGEKVDDSLTRSFSNGRVHGHGYFEQKASSMKQLAVEVSELHVGDNGELWITCMSTIPGYVGYNENYADVRKHSRQIEVLMTEVPAEIISNTNEIVDSSSSSSSNNSNNNAATLKDTDIMESIYPFFIAALIVFLF